MPTTLNKVLKDMNKFETSKGKKRDPRNYDFRAFEDFNIRAYPRNKSVIYGGLAESASTGKYYTYIQFHRIKIFSQFKALTGKEKRDQMKIVDIKDNEYLINPHSMNSSCSLKCTCLDFKFTWEYHLHKKGGLIGNWRRYRDRKGTHPPRNPKKALGVCKHLWQLIKILNQYKLVR